MFIKNDQKYNTHDYVKVDYATKRYLETAGFPPLAYQKGKWIFKKTKQLVNILSSRKGGTQTDE